MSTGVDTQPKRRRGTRVRAQIPVRVTSLDPASTFSESCHTLLVNPQGCGVRFARPLEPGLQVRMDDLPGGGSITARVASSLPPPEGSKYWLIGICLDRPGTLWFLGSNPPDWRADAPVPRSVP